MVFDTASFSQLPSAVVHTISQKYSTANYHFGVNLLKCGWTIWDIFGILTFVLLHLTPSIIKCCVQGSNKGSNFVTVYGDC